MPGKRRAGEGSVSRRKDGRYVARRTVGGRGNALVLHGYGRTEDEAWSALARRIEQHNRQLQIGDVATWTVKDLFDWWIREELPERVADRKLSPTTLRGYDVHTRRRIIPGLGDIPIAELNAAHVRRWLADMRKDGAGDRMRQYAHAVLRAGLQTAVRYEWLDRNAAALVQAPRVVYERRDEVTLAEARRLVAAASGSRLAAMWLLMLHIPLRSGEPAGAEWAAFDLDRGLYRVERNLVRDSGAWILNDIKSHRQRIVPLPEPVVAALRAHREQQTIEASFVDGWVNPEVLDRTGRKPRLRPADLVFRAPDGRPLWVNRMNADLADVCEAAGVRRLTTHQLRHAAVTLLGAQGVDPRVVMQLAGHSTMRMHDLYTGVLEQAAVHAVNELSRTLFEGKH